METGIAIKKDDNKMSILFTWFSYLLTEISKPPIQKDFQKFNKADDDQNKLTPSEDFKKLPYTSIDFQRYNYNCKDF